MNYKEWKRIDDIVRNPRFCMTNNFGVTMDMIVEKNKFNSKFNRKEENKFWLTLLLIPVLLFSIPVGGSIVFIFVENYYEVQALENLTGKQLDYWDVFWAGSKIRANSELISKGYHNE